MRKILLLVLSGAFFTIATPAEAQAEAHIYLNPFSWIFPQPRVVKVIQPRYKVVKKVRHYNRGHYFHNKRHKPTYKRYNKYKKVNKRFHKKRLAKASQRFKKRKNIWNYYRY